MSSLKERIQLAASASRVALSVNFEVQLEATYERLAVIEVDDEPDPQGYAVENGIGHLKIRGLLAPNVGEDWIEWGLTGYDVLVAYIESADADEAVEELWLDVDSDGGFADGVGTVVAALENFSKPIRTFVTGNMNSAAYHIGVIGNPIVATNELSQIGSIGAYSVHTEYSAAYEREGIKKRLFRSGRWKGAFNNFTPLTETEEQRLQAEVDEVAGRFFAVVAAHRDLSVDEIKAFDGDHFRAKDALTKKLIDAIGEMEMPGPANPTPTPTPAPTGEQAPGAPGTFTQADIDAAVARANEARDAADARAKEIRAHTGGTDALKEMYATDPAFAAVPLDKVKAALDAATPTGKEMLNAAGGAGVQADRNDPPASDPDKAKETADKQAAALETLKNRKGSVL